MKKKSPNTSTVLGLSNEAQNKDSQSTPIYINETQRFFDYLQENTATASMVTAATGIVQKNICRYKRELGKLGLLWEVDYKPCKITGFMSSWLSTNPDMIPKVNNQPNLFDSVEGLSL